MSNFNINTENMTAEQMKAEIERLKTENEQRSAQISALSKEVKSEFRLKVSQKGAISAYGLGRFPVTLYLEQWLKLLPHAEEIKAFISANESQIKAQIAYAKANPVKKQA